MIFLDNFFFEEIWLIFEIQNWLWKYDFGTFWQTVISRRNFLKVFLWWYVDWWPKSLLLRTQHLWNSTTELILIKHVRGQNFCLHNTYVVPNRKSTQKYFWSNVCSREMFGAIFEPMFRSSLGPIFGLMFGDMFCEGFMDDFLWFLKLV